MLKLSDDYHKAERYTAAMKNHRHDLGTLVKRVSEIKSILDAGSLNKEEMIEVSEEMHSINSVTDKILMRASELKSMTFNLDAGNIDEIEIGNEEQEAFNSWPYRVTQRIQRVLFVD